MFFYFVFFPIYLVFFLLFLFFRSADRRTRGRRDLSAVTVRAYNTRAAVALLAGKHRPEYRPGADAQPTTRHAATQDEPAGVHTMGCNPSKDDTVDKVKTALSSVAAAADKNEAAGGTFLIPLSDDGK